MNKTYIRTAIFGSGDGLLAAIALVLATASHGRTAVLQALFALFIAEGLGMGVADFLSTEKTTVGWKEALVMSLSTGITILLIGLPWLITNGHRAEYASGVVAILIGAAISQTRPGGWSSWAQTLGLLAAVASITGFAGHL